MYFLVVVSATAGSEFIPISIPLKYPPGPANGNMMCINISITDDQLFEGNETFMVRLSNPMPSRVMLNANTTVTIIDDEGQ